MIEHRLKLLREEMARADLDALVIPRADEYLGEYLPPHNERLRWATGFTGSAGVAIILRETAAIFVDGRYRVQVRQQVPATLFEYHHLLEEPHLAWLAAALAPGARVGCDPRLHTPSWFDSANSTLAAAGMSLQASTDNLIDRCWSDRPPARVEPALLLGMEYSGESSIAKRQRVGAMVAAAGADVALIFAPDSISWLLNVRGTDVPMMPVLQSCAVLAADGGLTLLVDPERIPDGFAQHVGDAVTVLSETETKSVLTNFSGRRVLIDPQGVNAWTREALSDGGAILVTGDDPVVLPKAAKNSVEVEGARRAHVRDAVAEARFLAWLDREVAAGNLHDEAHLADVLFDFRGQGEHFHGGSFDTISAAGSNAAMCHYNHLDSDQP
ncbi:MAG: aminopeptidase P family N-terminal domain-containing protein, partial [Halieaceae bacterium]